MFMPQPIVILSAPAGAPSGKDLAAINASMLAAHFRRPARPFLPAASRQFGAPEPACVYFHANLLPLVEFQLPEELSTLTKLQF
jgi:hypothetical protein